MRRSGGVLLLCALLSPAAWPKDKKKDPGEIGNRDVGKGINFYSIEKEIALGKQLAQEVKREAKVVDDPLLTEYVNRLGQNLVRNSDANVPFTFEILDADDLNAFALPGGFIFVHTGLIKVAETEAELSAAMAHEIAHVAARHMTKQATRNQLVQLFTLPLAVIGGWTGYAIRQGAGVGIPMTFLKFDRNFESEADFLGLQYLYAAGYDPTASIDLFERMMSLEKTRPGVIAKVFSTHPMNAGRMQNAQKDDSILPAKPEYVINTSEYIEMRARLLAQQNRRKGPADPNRPTLRTTPGGRQTPVQDADDKDDRLTLKRRDLVE